MGGRGVPPDIVGISSKDESPFDVPPNVGNLGDALGFPAAGAMVEASSAPGKAVLHFEQ